MPTADEKLEATAEAALNALAQARANEALLGAIIIRLKKSGTLSDDQLAQTFEALGGLFANEYHTAPADSPGLAEVARRAIGRLEAFHARVMD